MNKLDKKMIRRARNLGAFLRRAVLSVFTLALLAGGIAIVVDACGHPFKLRDSVLRNVHVTYRPLD